MLHRHKPAFMLMVFGLAVFMLSLLIAVPAAQATPGGVTDAHGGFGYSCNGCHIGGQTPLVGVSGSTNVQPSQTVMYMLAVTSTAPLLQTHAGWTIAVLDDDLAAAGTLAPIAGDSGNQFVEDQLTHTAPRANVNGTATIPFKWTAPAASGTYTIYFAGNSVNNNWQTVGENGRDGDAAGLGTFTITVSEPMQVALVQHTAQTIDAGNYLIALIVLSAATYLIWQQRMGRRATVIRSRSVL